MMTSCFDDLKCDLYNDCMIHHWRDHPYFNGRQNLSLFRRHFFDLIKGSALIQVIASLIPYFSLKKNSNIFHDWFEYTRFSSMTILEDPLNYLNRFRWFFHFLFWTMTKSRFSCVCISVAVSFWIVTDFSFRHLDFLEKYQIVFSIWKKKKSRWFMILMMFSSSQQMSRIVNLKIFLFYLNFGNTFRCPEIGFLL